MNEINNEVNYEIKYKYLLAEYDNYRKRIEREAEMRVINEKTKLLLKLIDIKDDFERALEVAEKVNDITILNGLKAILKNIDNILKEEGVSEIDTKGKPFDPNLHEVVSMVTDNSLPHHTITNVLRKGYMLYNKVIRPSLVEISTQNEQSNVNINNNEVI